MPFRMAVAAAVVRGTAAEAGSGSVAADGVCAVMLCNAAASDYAADDVARQGAGKGSLRTSNIQCRGSS
jgi:hypothetical protein